MSIDNGDAPPPPPPPPPPRDYSAANEPVVDEGPATPDGGIPDWTYSPDQATKHGLESVESHDGHGVNDDALNNAVRDPQSVEREVDNLGRPATIFTGKDATVVLNDDGQVVTAWPRNSNGYRYP